MPPRTPQPATRTDLVFTLLVAVLLIALWALRSVAMLVAFAVLLAYMLDPLASQLERIPFPGGRRVPRALSALVIIALGVSLIAGLAAFAIPLLATQLVGFFDRLPALIEALMDDLRARAIASGRGGGFEAAVEAVRTNARTLTPQLAGATLRWIGGAFARFDQILGLAVLPVLTFYLLADRRRVQESMLRFMPEAVHANLVAVGASMHRALQSYVRGQAVVCLVQGTATGAMLAIAGLPNALLLGVLAGAGEVLPFLGAFLTGTAIVLSGLTRDVAHAVIGLAIYLLNNWLLATFVTPRVMERYLKLHPFAVIVSVLAGAQLLGPAGAIVALPAAAVVQAVVEDFALHRRKRAD
jgi:predicted PurR-regulated permease PerM